MTGNGMTEKSKKTWNIYIYVCVCVQTYSAYDVLMVSQVRLAVLAPINLVATEVRVVRKTHLGSA